MKMILLMMVIKTTSLLIVVAVAIDIVETIGGGKANYSVMTVVIVVVIAANISLTKSVLVVVHPNLEHPFANTNFIAELFNQTLIALLHLPPQFFREREHLLLLLLTELGAKPLSSIWDVLPRHRYGMNLVLIGRPRTAAAES